MPSWSCSWSLSLLAVTASLSVSSPVGHCLQSPNPAFAQVETQQQGHPVVGVEEGLRAGLPPEGKGPLSPGEAAHSPVA